MTPLAYRMVKELTLPLKRRPPLEGMWLAHAMDDVHCFEVSDVLELFEELQASRRKLNNASEFFEGSGHVLFLPAPKTWIEWEYLAPLAGRRQGYLLVEREAEGLVEVNGAVGGPGCWWSFPIGKVDLRANRCQVITNWLDFVHPARREAMAGFNMFDELGAIPTMLALINAPRVIGRQQHMPRRSLEKALLKSQRALGSFPLHAWTEIKLEVHPPEDMSDLPGYEAHLTGKRCLHFCRAHLRLRRGALEFVRSHWRGDASLGIKQSRYKLVPA